MWPEPEHPKSLSGLHLRNLIFPGGRDYSRRKAPPAPSSSPPSTGELPRRQRPHLGHHFGRVLDLHTATLWVAVIILILQMRELK